MYIEYVRPQQIADPNFTDYKSKGGDYRPTWLIRTADWQKVPGRSVIDGYHTLSYVWEQSGEMFKKDDGEYGLIDKGAHRITTKVHMKRKSRRSVRYHSVSASVRVKFDQFVQQICKDFGIAYIWYDKICIDQNDKAAKHREIKEMHMIYSNAQYTLALVPEINIKNPKEFNTMSQFDVEYTEAKNRAIHQMVKSLWWSRSWTLEELMMSTRILVVGRNTYFWSLADIKQDIIKENDFLASTMLGFKNRDFKSANRLLKSAHFRTSTRPHDKIYALANILHDIIDIDIDYDADVSLVMNNFYRQLAQIDLSMMCFGSVLYPAGIPQYESTMGTHKLPSWTGVAGLHSGFPIIDIAHDDSEHGYRIDERMCLHIKCRSFTIQPTPFEDFTGMVDETRVAQAGEKFFGRCNTMDDFEDEQAAIDWTQNCTFSVTSCYPTHYWKPPANSPCSPLPSLSLTEECEECNVLSIVFPVTIKLTQNDRAVDALAFDYLSPVVKANADGLTHKVIGFIHLHHFKVLDENINPDEFLDLMFIKPGYEARDFCIQ